MLSGWRAVHRRCTTASHGIGSLTHDAVQLFVDPDHVVRATDPSGREALLGCGAVLDHFLVAMAAAGWAANVGRFPNPNNLLHVASIDFSPMEFVAEAHLRRANAILLRRTDRLPFAPPPEWDSFEFHVRRSFDAELVRLDVIADDQRARLAEASQLTESVRLYDSSYHAELHWWTAAFDLREGIPHSSLVSAAESDRVDVGRSFPVTHHRERREEVGEDHSKILVLSTYDDTHESVLACGEKLSAVLLDAAMVGLASCTLTHITEVPASRAIVAEMIGQQTTPQVLIRIGLAPSTRTCRPRPRADRSTRFSSFASGTNDGATGTFASRHKAVPSIASEPDNASNCRSRHARSLLTVALRRRRNRRFTIGTRCRVVGCRRGGQSRYPAAPRLRHRPGRRRRQTPSTRHVISLPAEIAVRHAVMAVESTDQPVKIEVEILQDRPVRVLLEASDRLP